MPSLPVPSPAPARTSLSVFLTFCVLLQHLLGMPGQHPQAQLPEALGLPPHSALPGAAVAAGHTGQSGIPLPPAPAALGVCLKPVLCCARAVPCAWAG